MTGSQARPWREALLYALLARRVGELVRETSPAPEAVVAWVRDHDALAEIVAVWADRRAAGKPWPVPLPADLAVPAAQLAAALQSVRSGLGLLGARTAPAGRSGPPSAEELRLRADRPPHHGG